MAEQRSVKLKMAYDQSEETRNYTIDNVTETDAIANTVRGKVQDFNAYLATATVSPVFVSPTGQRASEITEAKIIIVEETPIEGV